MFIIHISLLKIMFMGNLKCQIIFMTILNIFAIGKVRFYHTVLKESRNSFIQEGSFNHSLKNYVGVALKQLSLTLHFNNKKKVLKFLHPCMEFIKCALKLNELLSILYLLTINYRASTFIRFWQQSSTLYQYINYSASQIK